MTNISRFAIRGLYNERDIDISFDGNIKILVAENGNGKTTVLNALHALASGDVTRLRKIPFKSLELQLVNGRYFEIDKDSLEFASHGVENHALYTHIRRRLGVAETDRLLEMFLRMSPTQFRRSLQFHDAVKRAEIPPSSLFELVAELIKTATKDGVDLSAAQATIKEIRETLDFNVLYLPTYRRVEQDFRDLRTTERDSDLAHDTSINFGMSDVAQRIKEVTQEIIASSVAWFSKVNGEMLSQLVEGFGVDAALRESVRDPAAVEIVLNRIGSNISAEQKLKIIELVESGEILKNHDPLVYFISNLLKVYEQQKENDKSIQEFTEVCNRYLTDKKLEYDESSVSVRIVRRKNGHDVDIETLSSGEKQIISLFCSLYLKRGDNFAIFFDEPELSLSIEWQKTLLPDVLRSGKCSFLFATTHSPFIFENELGSYAVDLGNYIREL